MAVLMEMSMEVSVSESSLSLSLSEWLLGGGEGRDDDGVLRRGEGAQVVGRSVEGAAAEATRQQRAGVSGITATAVYGRTKRRGGRRADGVAWRGRGWAGPGRGNEAMMTKIGKRGNKSGMHGEKRWE